MIALNELDLKDCISLQSLPCKLDSLSNLQALKMSKFAHWRSPWLCTCCSRTSAPREVEQTRAAAATNCSFLVAIVECGAVPALGLRLQSDEAAVQEQAARARGNITIACGEFTEAAKACRWRRSHPGEQAARDAASIIRYAKVIHNQLSGLPLARLLGSSIPAVRGQAVHTVKLLAYCPSKCSSLAAGGAIPAVLRLLMTGTQQCRRTLQMH